MVKRPGIWMAAAGVALLAGAETPSRPAAIRIDYPEPGTLFPPDLAAPAFLFRDNAAGAVRWRIEVKVQGGAATWAAMCRCERLPPGAVDARAVSETNRPPELTREQAAARVWRPERGAWELIKRNSTGRPAEVTITGFARDGKTVSRGAVAIETSRDPVGAPIFYRDVPLMPSELEKGVIKPLAPAAVPLIAWRLKNVGEPGSRVLLEGMQTCANCHSFSRDGKTLGMDLDGPGNDKGLYTLVGVAPRMSIRNEDVIAWSTFRGKLGGSLRVGFMSQVSPDGKHVVTMIEGPQGERSAPVRPRGRAGRMHFYVANFKDYRFLQVFYPTRGILAWYSRETGVLQALPGADDPRYVQTNAVWSPDGKCLVFARAEARDPYPEGRPAAAYANHPNETPIRYDLYRIPFNGGRGGKAEPVAGASHNGASNSFPKVSPDGRWIVYVQAANGLLMRPDSRLFIVPAAGGVARALRANLPLMNSWHSFSPNGRWLVFSSKARSPYTQMYLTHIDEAGRDTPAVLVEGATAANRAVNIPEFVNIAADRMMEIRVPAVEFYTRYQAAWELMEKDRYEEAAAGWRRALELNASDARALINYGFSLMRLGRLDAARQHLERSIGIDGTNPEAWLDLGIVFAMGGRLREAIGAYEKALALDSGSPEVLSNLGVALVQTGRREEGIAHYRQALEANPDYPEVHNNLAAALAVSGRVEEAIPHFRKVVELRPDLAAARGNLGRALVSAGRAGEAIAEYGKALAGEPRSAEFLTGLGMALAAQGRRKEAAAHFERALEANPEYADAHYHLGDALHAAGDTAGALAHWRAVLRVNPDFVPVLVSVARVLATSTEDRLRNGVEAVALAERAARIDGGRGAAVLDALAAAYAEAGRFAEAVAMGRRALEAAERSQPGLVESLRTRIVSYEAGRAVREP
jgi:tetratricopeptide (TPR) repeat protein